MSVVAQKGQVSWLATEMSSLRPLEILQLKLTGDQTVALNCAVADFAVTQGVMQVHALALDTAVNTVVGSGQVNRAQETLDLTTVPSTKVASLAALRGPVYVKDRFNKPVFELNSGSIAARSAGALAFGLLNPLLALLPLFEPGSGVDSDCARLVRQAWALAAKAGR